MKNVVVVTQYFPPEIGGGAHRSFGFVEELAKLGAQVTVVTAFPSYLIHKKHAPFRFKAYEKNLIGNNITVYRTFVIPGDRGSLFKRLLYYFSFTISSTLLLLFKIRNIDILLAISPPLFTGITGIVAKRFKSATFVLDIGDLWPESAIQLKILRNRFAIWCALKLERWIYHHCDGINVVTLETLKHFQDSHKNGTSLSYVPNFVDTTFVRKSARDASLQERLGLKDKLVFGYIGNIGVAQGINVIVQAAALTRHMKDIVYLVVGDGVERVRVEREIESAGLGNILLLPPVSREEIVKYMMLVDVMIIPLVKADLFRVTIPSKLYESMAAEIPVILCVDGEARTIVEQARCGVFAEPESPDMLVDKVMCFYRNRHLVSELGQNGRSVVEQRFDRNKVIQEYFKPILTAIACSLLQTHLLTGEILPQLLS